jgi:beta-lactamase regulating signal transducer with metallopeptidase domain
MFGEFFYWIFNMSIIASFTGVIVLLIRSIRAIPRRVSVFLWVVPFLRMCIPVGLNNPYSLMSLISRFTTKTVTVYRPSDGISFSVTNSVMAANSYFPIKYKVDSLANVFAVASLIWLVVALAMIIALGILYFTTFREIKDAKHMRDNIYLSEKAQSPAVYGIFKPRIILPLPYESADNRYILRHERTHIRRADNLWRLLAFLTVAVHWFNPLAWLFLKLFLTDIELACDESAVSQYNEEQRKEYALSLIDSSESKNLFVSAFGGAKIRLRIENLLSYKRMTRISLWGFSTLILSVLIALLTNAG